MINLDNLILKKAKNSSSSILLNALIRFDGYEGRVFFHQNFPAFICVRDFKKNDLRNISRWRGNWKEDQALNFKSLDTIYGGLSIDEQKEIRTASTFSLQGNNCDFVIFINEELGEPGNLRRI